MGGRDAPRLAHGSLAAGERHRLEVRDALEAGQVAPQDLTAPDRPVGSVTRPVEHDREGRPGLAVLGQTGRGVSVVMLHLDHGHALLPRPACREVIGVEVARDRGGLDAEHVEP